MISRKSELRDILGGLADIEEQVERLSDQLNRTQAEAAHVESVRQELRTAIYEASTAKVEASAALQSIAQRIERLTQEQPLIASEVAQLEREMAELRQRTAEGDRSLEELNRENAAREERVSGRQAHLAELSGQRREAQEKLTAARVRVGQLTEKRTAAYESIAGRERSLRSIEEAMRNARLDIEQCEERLAQAEALVVEATGQREEVQGAIAVCEERAQALRREREQLRAQMEGLAEQMKKTRQALEAAEESLHRHQMQATETKVRRDELVARVREELGLSLAERYEEYEHADQDWDAVEQEIAELRGKIDRLGNVNLDAIDELQELEERHTFLTTQRDDLTSSRRQLQDLIVRLDHEAGERFKKTFDEIRTQFRALFRKLFGGGRADVILEDPEQLLESGIEILAQPPGKELQSISLMSGGEKSMTAIALVMSMFRSRPAPFAILDEVDAALDEANNVRFNQIVQEFLEEAQFIIITHSRRTMSVGDQLYGITMQEPGVSTRVAVQFADAEVA